MITTERAWKLLRIALPIAGILIIFFSGIFPLEDLLSFVQPQQLTASVSSAEVVSLTNENRVEDNLPALTTSSLLTQAAQLKAEDMAANSYYAHINPDGKTPLYWLELVGYHYLNAGENLVIDRTTSEEVVSAWMNSPDHRENILRPQFTEIGVGVAQGVYQGLATTYVVQEFGTPYPSPQITRKAVPAASAPLVTTVPTTLITSANPADSVAPAPRVQTTPATFRPQPIPLPTLPTSSKPHTKPVSKTSNTLVNSVAALAAPVTETIQVHPVVTPSATSTGASVTAPSTATSTSPMPVFSLPEQSNTVIALPADAPAPQRNMTPISDYQTALGKQRAEFIRTRIQNLWAAFTSFIF